MRTPTRSWSVTSLSLSHDPLKRACFVGGFVSGYRPFPRFDFFQVTVVEGAFLVLVESDEPLTAVSAGAEGM